MGKAKILIVEDEIIVAHNLQVILQRLGYSTPIIALSGKIALRQIAKVRPDLVLMDIVLKGDMDGIQAAEQIDTDYGIPVIYVTAHSDPSTVARAKATRPSGYILKPFDEKKLQETIEAALAFQRQEKSRAAHPESPAKPASILLLNSNPQMQVTLTSLLGGRGHRVVLANRALDAVKMLRETRFDLILMDLTLPDARGEVFIRGLRREMGIDTPVIVMAEEITAEILAFLKPDKVSGFLSRSGDYQFRLLTEVEKALGRPPAPEAEEEEAGGDDWADSL